MTRKIKFRAWIESAKIMTEIDKIDFRNNEVAFGFHDIGVVYFRSINEVELMQFTGLEDKNGKQIYEGDILKIYYQNNQKSYLKQVKWLNDAINKGRWDALDNCAYTSCEIVGNIFENPKLLEDK
jgi:uncharacterized phage protein (TIGR01671 family)